MSGDIIVLVIGVIVVALIATLGFVFRAKRVKVSAAAHELRRAEATRRGWTFVASGNADDARGVYSGTTDFVPWRCEMSARHVPGVTLDSPSRQATHTRWWTEAARAAEALLIVGPRSGNVELLPANLPPEFLARIAPLLNTLGLDPKDVPLLASATPFEDPALTPGYRLRTTHPLKMQEFLDSGAREAFASASPWLADATPHPLMVMILGSRGLSILVEGWMEDLDAVQRLATLGASLSRAASRERDD